MGKNSLLIFVTFLLAQFLSWFEMLPYINCQRKWNWILQEVICVYRICFLNNSRVFSFKNSSVCPDNPPPPLSPTVDNCCTSLQNYCIPREICLSGFRKSYCQFVEKAIVMSFILCLTSAGYLTSAWMLIRMCHSDF